MSRKRLVQIIVIVLIVIALAVLFFAKQSARSAELSQPEVTLPATSVVTEDHADSAIAGAQAVPDTEMPAGTASGIIAQDDAAPGSVEVEPLFVSSIDEEALRSSGMPVMIQFFSTTCVPCMSMMDDLRAFYSENYGRVKVVALNIEEYPEAAMDYPVVVVPTQLFFTSEGELYVPSSRIRASVGGFASFVYTDTQELAYVVHQGVLDKEQMERIAADAGAEP